MNESHAIKFVGPPTLADEINGLIDFYEHHGRPGAGMRIPVNASPRQLAQALRIAAPTSDSDDQREFMHRGRVLVAIK